MSRTDHHNAPREWTKADAKHLAYERRANRRRDKHALRTVADWDNYAHPRHPFDWTTLPSH